MTIDIENIVVHDKEKNECVTTFISLSQRGIIPIGQSIKPSRDILKQSECV